ncbi:MAG TPA: peptidylprolyl isomerase [Longimicrobium sp.]|jgi:peptidyl-prolyl cis-trans isomerase B (cyclophilin B)|uniref:peptidylprolyl isomerase n=1 Tax=Longimicrobium sp. TaxID=2029185 RepID=UPI002ED9B546
MPTVNFTTNKGSFSAELYPNEAPETVANFTRLVKDGYYDGIIFHRVIPDFVVQGGDPITKGPRGLDERGVGSGGPGWQIKCETRGNPHRHEVGSLSMAHAGKDTGGSQFFIVLSEQNTTHLNGVHTVFGKVTQGLDVVNQLARGDRMEKVTVDEAAAA